MLRRDLYYTVIFGEAQPVPHDNARCEFYDAIESSLKAFITHFSIGDFSQHCASWNIFVVLRLHAFSAGWNCQGESRKICELVYILVQLISSRAQIGSFLT